MYSKYPHNKHRNFNQPTAFLARSKTSRTMPKSHSVAKSNINNSKYVASIPKNTCYQTNDFIVSLGMNTINQYENNTGTKQKISLLNIDELGKEGMNDKNSIDEIAYKEMKPEPWPVKPTYSGVNNNYINNSSGNTAAKTISKVNSSRLNQWGNTNSSIDDSQDFKLIYTLRILDWEELLEQFSIQYVKFSDLFLLKKDDLQEMQIPIGPRNRILYFAEAYRNFGKVYDYKELVRFFQCHNELVINTPTSDLSFGVNCNDNSNRHNNNSDNNNNNNNNNSSANNTNNYKPDNLLNKPHDNVIENISSPTYKGVTESNLLKKISSMNSPFPNDIFDNMDNNPNITNQNKTNNLGCITTPHYSFGDKSTHDNHINKYSFNSIPSTHSTTNQNTLNKKYKLNYNNGMENKEIVKAPFWDTTEQTSNKKTQTQTGCLNAIDTNNQKNITSTNNTEASSWKKFYNDWTDPRIFGKSSQIPTPKAHQTAIGKYYSYNNSSTKPSSIKQRNSTSLLKTTNTTSATTIQHNSSNSKLLQNYTTLFNEVDSFQKQYENMKIRNDERNMKIHTLLGNSNTNTNSNYKKNDLMINNHVWINETERNINDTLSKIYDNDLKNISYYSQANSNVNSNVRAGRHLISDLYNSKK